jgi:hypothetical protein
MTSATTEIDEQIERLRKGDTLAENEVKALCDKVRVERRNFLEFVNWIMTGENIAAML